MIVTVTFNPSLDYIVSVKDFELGKTNRTDAEKILPGGKGINVAEVLTNLGMESTALGFEAGFTGKELLRLLNEKNIPHDFIHIGEGMTRINFKLLNYDGTEVNGMGPIITEDNLNQLKNKLNSLNSSDTLVLSGSVPSSLPKTMYKDILEQLKDKNIRFTVDAEKDLLLSVLPYHPFLIKPNLDELNALFNTSIREKEEVIPYAQKLQEMGACNVLVSMGGRGAVLLDEEKKTHQLNAPKGTLINAVGAGDSMVAGFLAGYEESRDYDHAFRMAVAAGSASAFSSELASKEEIIALYETL